MNADEAKAKAQEWVSLQADTFPSWLIEVGASEFAQSYLDAIAVLEKIAEAEIPLHGSMDSWAINMARDFLDGVTKVE